MNIVTRTSNLSPYLKTCTQVIGTQVKPLVAASVVSPEKVITQPAPDTITSFSLAKSLPSCGNIRVASGPTVGMQVRYAHTDIQVPDFSAYRRSPSLEPTHKNRDSAPSRKGFTYLIVGAGAIGSVVTAKGMVHLFVSSMSASADVLALAKIELNLSSIPEGKCVTFKWRGKPLFIRHRTGEEIQTEQNVNVASLRDPQADSERVQKPEWLIVIGVCTHLGCVPIANAGDFGGYYCPCHGSHYDASGRIRKGPAPLNLEVPPYEFQTDDILVVG